MATSLASQLSKIAADSKSTLNVKAQRSAHAKSLLFEPRVAAAQTYATIYTVCYDGFEELCHLDGRFAEFGSTLFSQASQEEDRTLMTPAENARLDETVTSFLHLVGSRLRLLPAVKSVEWLIRRFRYENGSL
jgi:U3 small nucleolar RNA-associated protein 10